MCHPAAYRRLRLTNEGRTEQCESFMLDFPAIVLLQWLLSVVPCEPAFGVRLPV
jgi:hypothetical protein